MTLFFSNSDITIYRRRQISGTNRFSVSATYTSYRADIQPASQERLEFVDGRFGKTFTAFVEASVDIKENDQLVTADGKRYSVLAVSSWQGAGMLDHKELIITSQDG